MKTAEEILKRHLCSKCEGNLVMSVNDIGAIQLDAFKAGAEWAAKQFPPTVKNSSSWMDGVEDMQEAILSASKEINEIPKND